MRQVAEMKTAEVVDLFMKHNYDLLAAQEVKPQVEKFVALDFMPEGNDGKDAIALAAYGWLCGIAPVIIRAAQQGALEWLPNVIFIGKGKNRFALLAPDASHRLAYCL